MPGCVSGSLASDTGPRTGDSVWSAVPRQRVHVGETVRFDFVITEPVRGGMIDPTGVADYCIVSIGPDRIHINPDTAGHFQFEHTFDNLRAGEKLVVRARAYRVRGHRDYMKIAGRWMRSESPTDIFDQKVAADSIALTAYTLTLELKIQPRGIELDAESGLLRIQRDDGSEVVRYIDRPHRPGFTVDGPDARGAYLIRYHTRSNELNRTGKTTVGFEIHDQNGKRIAVTRVFDTP